MVAGAIAGGITGGVLGGIGGFLGQRAATKSRRRQRRAINQAREFADEILERDTGADSFFGKSEAFLTNLVDGGAVGSPLARDYAKAIQAAQASRGLFTGNASIAAEGAAVSGFAQQLGLQASQLSDRFAGTRTNIRNSVLAAETPLLIAAATGGQLAGVGPSNISSAFGASLEGAIAGGLGGAQIGAGLQSQFANTNRLDALAAESAARTAQVTAGQAGPGAAVGNDVVAPSTAALFEQGIHQSQDPRVFAQIEALLRGVNPAITGFGR